MSAYRILSPLLAYHAEVLADGPVLYLRFGEASGSVAKDELGMSDGAYPMAGVTLGAAGALENDKNTGARFDGAGKVTMPPGFDFSGTAPF